MASTCTESGLTLVELLVAMAIMAGVLAGISSLFAVHNRMAAKQEETTLMQQELLSSVARMAEELRMCGYSPTGKAGFGFVHAPGTGSPDYGRATNETSVYCTLDWNGNGELSENGTGSSFEHVSYRVNTLNSGARKSPPDNVLRKYDTGAVHWQPSSTNIADLRFAYFDANGDPIPDPGGNTDRIRMVRIEATAVASSARAGLGINNRTMSTNVWCRNLGQ